MEAVAKLKHIRITPMKARRVVNLIRGKQASEALAMVKADAANILFDESDLIISKAFVDEGTTLKRFMPRAQGRAFQILKRTSHITVVVATPDELKASK